jgi:hypothetical protein
MLIVINDENQIDIAEVLEVSDQAVMGRSSDHDYNIPIGDVRQYVGGPTGRTFVYSSTIDNVQDTKRLAELEKSIVLRSITQYTQSEDPGRSISWREILLYALVAALTLGVIFK